MKSAIGIDIGGTNLRIGLVREDGTVVNTKKIPSSILCRGGTATALLIREIQVFVTENANSTIKGIGIGFPAPVSSDGKTVFPCPNLKNQEGGFENVVGAVSEYFNLPVRIAKDTDMLLQAEVIERGAGKDDIFVAFYFGTGVGNSVYYRGAILTGAHGSGFDTGHIPLYKGTRKCGCGQIGCLECYASGAALKTIWEECFDDCTLDEVFLKHRYDPKILDWIDACAAAIATEVIIFDPSIAIIGGGVVDMEEFPFDSLQNDVYARLKKPYPAEYVKIERAQVRKHAGIKGAAYLALGL